MMISIVCNTYNHAKYIADALEGFVNQKTTFPFEVLVMDDASTDGTADIIRAYEKKYPEIIKPIYQSVNQYSRGLKPGLQNQQRATGKYIALCEGDDYWIDNQKLQKQVTYMEDHPECTFCFTNGYAKYDETIGKKVIPWDRTAKIYKGKNDLNAGELELFGYIPTASFLFPNSLSYPEMPSAAFKGDTYVKNIATAQGYAHFIDEPMVVYRRNVANSATQKWEQNLESMIKQCDSFILLFQGLNEVTKYKYQDCYNMRICQHKIEKFYRLGDKDELKKIIRSGEIKTLQYGNLYLRIICNAKCRYCAQFKRIRSVIKRLKMFNR